MDQAIIDHDLIVELRTEMKGVTAKLDRIEKDIKEIKDDSIVRIERVEREKLNLTEYQKGYYDHEGRLRFLERYAWLAIGSLAIIEIGLQFVHVSGK